MTTGAAPGRAQFLGVGLRALGQRHRQCLPLLGHLAQRRDELAQRRIARVLLAEAADEGFNAIGVSGGEPLLYEPLPRLLRTAHALGYTASVTTNGLPLNARRVDAIGPYVKLIAIIVDGAPASHDRMRSLPGAFDRMRARLPMLRAAGVPFGLIFTLTLHNLHELAEVSDFAVAEGARLLQVHPLESAGRARV